MQLSPYSVSGETLAECNLKPYFTGSQKAPASLVAKSMFALLSASTTTQGDSIGIPPGVLAAELHQVLGVRDGRRGRSEL